MCRWCRVPGNRRANEISAWLLHHRSKVMLQKLRKLKIRKKKQKTKKQTNQRVLN